MGKNEVVNPKNFELVTMSAEMAEAIAEEMDGLGSLPFDRVKIPSGGNLAFELPGEEEDDPDYQKEIVGVILDHHAVNSYWADKYNGSSEQPDCSSLDGKTGTVRETGERVDCATCPYNQFGSDNAGKACKNAHRLYILREGNPIPLILILPPTSIRAMRDYIGKKVLLQGLRCWQAITKITLKKDKNADGIEYSKAVFTYSGKLSDEQMQSAELMKESIRQSYRQLDIVEENPESTDFVEVESSNTGEVPFKK